MSDIGDMNSDLKGPISIVDNVERIIEILCRLGIDSENTVITEVASHRGSQFLCYPRAKSTMRNSMDTAGDEVTHVRQWSMERLEDT